MDEQKETARRRDADTVKTLEISIRLTIVAGLVVWCFAILEPFLSTIVWALVMAAALHPTYMWLLRRFNRGRGATSTVFTALLVIALMTPVLMLSGTLVESARDFAVNLEDGALHVPPPPERVANLPVVGEKVYEGWKLASENLDSALIRLEEPIRDAGRWLIVTAAGVGLGIVQFAVALVLSGVFLAYSERGGAFARRLGQRLAGAQGEGVADMASTTVRTVAQGVLGVATIQAVMAGIGFMLAGIPGAGLWTMLVLILATVQLPAGILLIGSIFYVASVQELLPTVIYAAWMIFVTLVDNVLKPVLLGRGADAPAAVVSLGAIGGFLLQGIVGLFVGAVVLVLSYRLFMMWYSLDGSASSGGSPR